MSVEHKNTSGVFITFEGGEGSGKSTQSKLLAEALQQKGKTVCLTREPGGTQGAEIMRELLLSGALKSFGPEVETMMLYAARQDHMELVIKPALSKGAWVLCDRFSDSTRAYQGAADGVAPDFIDSLDQVVVGQHQPDVTFLLDIPAEDGLKRAQARRPDAEKTDRFEAADITFHEKLRQGFLTLAKSNPKRFVVLDARKKADDLAKDILSVLKNRFPEQV